MTDRHSHLIIACMAALALGFSAVTLGLVAWQKPADVVVPKPFSLSDMRVLPLPPRNATRPDLSTADFFLHEVAFEFWSENETVILGAVTNNSDHYLTSLTICLFPEDADGEIAGAMPLWIFDLQPGATKSFSVLCQTTVPVRRLSNCRFKYEASF